MHKFDGDKQQVAHYLGLSQTTLWRRLKHINIK
jgi:propionate catabolism operon transcriptional regulator